MSRQISPATRAIHFEQMLGRSVDILGVSRSSSPAGRAGQLGSRLTADSGRPLTPVESRTEDARLLAGSEGVQKV